MGKKKSKQRKPSPKAKLLLATAKVFTAVVGHLAIAPLDGVIAILKIHSRVNPFPDPVLPKMSLFNVFRLAPLGRENLTPDLSALRRSLGNKGLVKRGDARKAETVGDLVKLVE